MSDAEKLTAERGATHGDWMRQAGTAKALKNEMRQSANWSKLQPSTTEALDMIVTKISRILTGDHLEPDHFADIEGYAHLARINLISKEEQAWLNERERVRQDGALDALSNWDGEVGPAVYEYKGI